MSRASSIWTPDGEVSIKPSGMKKPDMGELIGMVESMMAKREQEKKPVIESRYIVPTEKIDLAITFWKPRYFDYMVDGRHLNGIEAFDLGNEKKNPKPNKVPFIAMCNLMALEALKIMGDESPTEEHADLLALGSGKERVVAAFWKEMFAPTMFQAEWAWSAALAVMAGSPVAMSELLDNYIEQLPD